MRPTLLGGAEDPFAAHLFGDLLMGDGPSRFDVRQTLFDSLDHVEVVQDVLERAVIRELVEEIANGVLGFHRYLRGQTGRRGRSR